MADLVEASADGNAEGQAPLPGQIPIDSSTQSTNNSGLTEQTNVPTTEATSHSVQSTVNVDHQEQQLAPQVPIVPSTQMQLANNSKNDETIATGVENAAYQSDQSTLSAENTQNKQNMASAPSYDVVVPSVNDASETTIGPPPPTYDESENAEEARVDMENMPLINENVAREALLDRAAEKLCWGSEAAKKMTIKEIISTSAYHYTLETYTEGRSTKTIYGPHRGGIVDGPENGPAPAAWNIPCIPSRLFQDEQRKIPIPHTEIVKICSNCLGRGSNQCNKCWGEGNVQCGSCHGTGSKVSNDSSGIARRSKCYSCNGTGRKICSRCGGRGRIKCNVCEGYGKIKQYIQLTVVFKNHGSDGIVERSGLPDHLVRKVNGTVLFHQEASRVNPIYNFVEQEINEISQGLVWKHRQSWTNEQVLQQRHLLRSVPVHRCHFEFEKKTGKFWVYGQEHSVYTKDYPHTCCCCRCVIL